METSRTRALRGPNLWSRHTAIETIATCTSEEQDIRQIPGFETRLRERFPAIDLPEGGKEVLSMAHVLEFAALGLQAQAGCPVTFSRTNATFETGVYQVVVEYSEEDVGRLAIKLALNLCETALNNLPFDLADALFQLRDLDEDVRLGPSTGSIVDAAIARGIPFRRLTQGSLVQFGWGSKQRRIQAAEIDSTSAISESIAQDKQLTKRLLSSVGVPVPKGRPVSSADDAWLAAQEIGGPVVIKPQDGNQGKGISVNIETREQIEKAYASALLVSDNILVESYLPGPDFRLLVVGDKLVAAARRDPPLVIGDGVHTVAELVAQVNLDPQRGSGHATSLTKIRLDDIAKVTLAKQDLTPESIPAKGVRVVLRNNANLSTGGTATDVTDDVHPLLAARAVAAAQMIGLDIAGVDVVCESVIRPMEDQHGGIVEINAAPGLRMHLSPSYGKGRDVGKAIISTVFGEKENGRIPVIAVAGTNGKTTTVRLTSHLLSLAGNRVGMTNSDGVYVQGERIDTGDCSGPRSARNILMHPEVDAAVFETARGGVLREGLAFDRCDVAIVTNIGVGDHLGLNYIRTVDDLAVVKRVIVQNVAPHGTAILNAADPMVVNMAPACPGKIIFFASDKEDPVLATCRVQGKRVVYLDGDAVVAREGELEKRILLSDITITHNGAFGFQIENAMAATAAAWALGLPWDVIRRGLKTFVNDAATAPGRFNMFQHRGATVIADYGHNPDAIIALVAAIDNIPAQRRSVVISGAGDRRDEDIRQQTQILGTRFDDVILYEDACQRGRSEGEVLTLLREGLQGATRTTQVDEIRGEFIAIDLAMGRLCAGDVCLILIDQVDEALEHIAKRVAEG